MQIRCSGPESLDLGIQAQLDRLDENVEEVRRFERAHPSSEVIGGCLAEMLFRCAYLYGSGSRFGRIDPLLSELRKLHAVLPAAMPVTESLAKAIYYARIHYGRVWRKDKQEALSAELGELLAEHERLRSQPPFDTFGQAAAVT